MTHAPVVRGQERIGIANQFRIISKQGVDSEPIQGIMVADDEGLLTQTWEKQDGYDSKAMVQEYGFVREGH